MNPTEDPRRSHAHDDHHGHDHGPGGHHHGPHAHGHRRRGHAEERIKDRQRLLLALLLSGSIAVAEGVGGWLTGSLALLSDAGHMLGDV
ncbi:MAG: cation transporter, partial [Myxococcaceae bacterium]|nr:cation transporter [Myxococcaceae bacterium]